MRSLSLFQNAFYLKRPRIAILLTLSKLQLCLLKQPLKMPMTTKKLKELEVFYYSRLYICIS